MKGLTFQKLSVLIPRGLDDFMEAIVSGRKDDLFKKANHFISIGSILVLISLFLLITVNI